MHTVTALPTSAYLDADVRTPIAALRKPGPREVQPQVGTPTLAAALALAVSRGLVAQSQRERLAIR
jgi:hypothetical protein